ncbi:hypothetical protein [Mucilaginibacter phyllosphaerae]|uniref:Lipoprotein n=1 Tax=Mucilaginibacter phyllosphaerae TaxID=1812349 RepID=A0ABR6I4F3_9SPHI|nr:hypothetical protein [Mucilaginibacter phyllosphaerae]MBB3967908.1 hypothetical protein [Mucilaginibacter phyllosphaerae]
MLILTLALQACNTPKRKIYTSECAAGIRFKKVSFANLADSIKYYDKQYVEVSGKYLEGKNQSALVNDSTYTGRSNQSLWVNFTQDCPLYLLGKRTGLFETEDGEYNKISDRHMTLRGRINLEKKGHNQAYMATINEVSYLELD